MTHVEVNVGAPQHRPPRVVSVRPHGGFHRGAMHYHIWYKINHHFVVLRGADVDACFPTAAAAREALADWRGGRVGGTFDSNYEIRAARSCPAGCGP